MAKISEESLRGEGASHYSLTHSLTCLLNTTAELTTHYSNVHVFTHSRTHSGLSHSPTLILTLGLPLRGMYNLGMISDKVLQAVVLWLNGRYCAAAAAAAGGVAALFGRAPSPPAGGTGPPITTNKAGRPTRQHSRLYSPTSSPQARS